MKVLDIYTRDEFNLITCGEIEICKMMDKFFLRFPSSYRENYDRNIETLEIQRVDEMCDDCDSADYYPLSNVILFKSFAALPHEFMHMASSDLTNNRFAFSRTGQYALYENGLLEGMTEFLSCMAKDGEPNGYFFECFTVDMLSEIDGIFEPYFISSYDKLISLFPNKKDIYSLMYALDFYHDKITTMRDDSSDDDMERISDSVRSVIDSLIDIELSFNKGSNDRKRYGEKFMDLISGTDIDCIVGDVYSDYIVYAHNEVKKRILRRM